MGIVGFSRCEGDWCWRVLIVRGISSYRIPLPYPIYLIVKALYKLKIKKKLEEYK
jgi:hypothetical protein